ncbi:MAG TPA: immunoglobulin domain-containing protein [Candidatus Dormibacteraeota bacterium]|nr:immunoglobulin domain-containing protein [Candidatus Dormibacteraeota bacterium]
MYRQSAFKAAYVRLLSLVSVVGSLQAQDILINDFEAATYGAWSTTGTAFGTGPASGPISGQSAVTGYQGSRFVDSFNGGDVSVGTLTSPPFTIQRKYIKFLIGGGNQRDKTCINLVVGGHVVRSAVGMGDRESLDWLQWNVSDLTNQTAQIQVVDSYSDSWGHINVDQIVQTDTSLSSVLTASQRYLNLPASYGGPSHLVELLCDGLVEHEFNINLVTSGTPDYYVFLDLSSYQGKELLMRVDSQLATGGQLAALVQSNNIVASTPIYQETLRPIYHFSARRGFINDPNGMVFYNGEYHLAYQHNPYGLDVGNQHWGNAVSTDLVHWQELPEAIYPDWRGQAWSGSSVVDSNNTAGFGANAIVSFYTAAGGHGNNPRMSLGQLFTQGLAYSLDSDRTLTKYTNNPVLPNVVGDNRDPRVIWYAPGNKWVMVLWLQNTDFGFFSSTDLRHWTQTSTFAFGNGVIEVPELFQLPLDGDPNNQKWIFYAGAGNYYVGTFDGSTFYAQNGMYFIRRGNSFAAAQTFDNVPASDGRRILIANGTQNYPNMPFQCAMDFPVELTLNTVGGAPTMFVNPVRELALLRTSTNSWPAQALATGVNIMSGTTGEAFDLDATFQPGAATSVTFSLRGRNVTYNCAAQTVSCSGTTQSLPPVGGQVRLQMLVDRGIIEIFGNNGSLYMPMSVTPTAGAQAVSLVATGNGATLNSLVMHNLGSAWNYVAVTNPPSTNAPAISAQPISATNAPGSTVVFTVTASGTAPLAYFWRFNGQLLSPAVNIASVTNSSLTISPAESTNAGTYDVIITNSAGSITSSPATLTFAAPTISSQPLPLTANLGGPGAFSVTASGGSPLYYQWRRNGSAISGATNSTLNLFPVAASYAGVHDVIVSNSSLSVTSSPALLTVLGPYRVARWSMEAQALTPNTSGSPTFNGVLDGLTNTGQGIVAVGGVVPAVRDDLITFSSLSGNPVILSNSVPPGTMFANSNAPGVNSFNAGAYAGGDGALFFPQDQYGNEFSFNSPFSVELFFKTHGDQSGAGPMQLLMQGETTFRYGITINDTVPGSVRFIVTNGLAAQAVAAVTNANYADGQWHYLLAVYDTLADTNGQIRLTLVNTNGSETTAITNLSAGFGPLRSGNDGNLFLGRFTYPIAQEHRTFLGLIDEVQITVGVVSTSWRLGKIASLDTPAPIQITGVTNTGTGIGFQWSSIAGQTYDVQWVSQLGNVWQTIISVLAAGASSTFNDTNLTRLNQPAGFYRISKP